MKKYPTNEIKNIVLLGASGAGKTTLVEAMAYEGKVIERRGSVEGENTLSDYTDIEHQNKHSIYSTVLYTEFNGYKLNVIDTPGADDFCGTLFSSFKVADVGVMLLNAQNGFEVGTEIQARYARRHEKPVIAAVNQLDAEKANWEQTIEELRANSEAPIVVVQYPVNPGPGFDSFIDVLMMKMYRFKGDNGEREELPIPDSEMERAKELNKALVEAAAENDEALMELYFEKGTLTQDEMRSGIKLGLAKRDLVPVFCLSARKDIGVKRLMEFIINVAPGPLKAPNFRLIGGGDVQADANGPVSIFVFKTAVEPHLGEVAFFRVISGTLTEGMELTNMATGNKEKIGQIFVSAGRNRTKVTELCAGDIGCTVKLKATRVNHTLNGPGADWQINLIGFPQPRFRTAVKAKNSAEDEKLGELLLRATYEDPSIVVEYSKELKQTILSGQGEHHLNILKNQLVGTHKIEVEFFPPRIPYRETITKTAAASYRHKKQSGGAGQFGEVSLVIEPYYEGMPAPSKYKIDGREQVMNIKSVEEIDLEWGGKLVFCSAIVGGAIDARFLPAILKGIMEKMEEGPLTGSYARDIRVVVYDGKMHPVDSNEISFKLAGRNAFKEAFRNAGPKIMEPIYQIEVLAPSDKLGDVMSDLQNRRAMIEGMTSEKGFEILTARVPLAEMNRYSTSLSSLTGGRATYTMKFVGYEQVPSDVQDKLLKAYSDTDKDE
ncbi:MAG TPA: elongation factor G [Candidatus Rikenella faecigallinarum]|uniref:Elongation factor G n=1 Tax=Candidatus Rikenella faecigallinarum TaxID=2838745 RepID=A0A9D1QER5_9BACT|nr:elongation factor G [Candidatus Rikenella faecigallinarum]